MVFEIDTTLVDNFNDITMGQLVFLSLVLNDNQKINQSVTALLSRVSDEEIQGLIEKDLISVLETENKKVYKVTEKVKASLKPEVTFFDQFYATYPVYVVRPDGTKGFLRANVNKCRKLYNQIVGKSVATHNHIMQCLDFELNQKYSTGKICYMKTMWKWLTNHEWELFDEQMIISTNTKRNMQDEFF